ncbi:PEP-CTERM sorting domain-containing protein [Bradyrhizobium sp. WSM1417]|uniref:PEP-CTERM sorting domain-containing protein n=1 Tax=Bradyrhizobium sp. WSM1417 TaxID=754500 RepID=UPI0004868A3F|nr:PEP-CTERM sorting domain-containing protein [Bradyrhizobium sp. WSM1417]
MLSRSFSFAAFLAAGLASSSALAGVVSVTSYDMNNGNGSTQYTFGYDYLDFTYNGANASTNGSNNPVPNNSTPQVGKLTGGTGLLTDGVIAKENYSMVSGSIATGGTVIGTPYNLAYAGGTTQYVGWKYQDPTITFHLAAGQSVSSIAIYAAAYNPLLGDSNGLVAAPGAVDLWINGNLVSGASLQTTSLSGNAAQLLLAGFGTVSSDSIFQLRFDRGELQQDGIDYFNDHVLGAYNNAYSCTVFCDPISGFLQEAAGGVATGPMTNGGLEPWIMLSEVQFLTTAVPEPSTWILMIAGFLGLGVVACRKSSKVDGASLSLSCCKVHTAGRHARFQRGSAERLIV